MKKFLLCVIASLLCAVGTHASTTGGVYQVITSTSDFYAGDTIILVSYDSDKNVYVMGTYDSSTGNAFYAINIGTTTADYLPPTITLDAVNSSGYAYEYKITKSSSKVNLSNNSQFIKGDDNNTNISMVNSSSTATTWTPYKYTNEKFGFDAVCLSKGTLRFICYTPLYGFKNYADFNSQNRTLAYCYKKVKTPFSLSIGSSGYATMYYGSNDVEMPDGLHAYTASIQESSGNYKVRLSSAGTTIPHGEGVVLKGTPNTVYHPLLYSAAATTANDLSPVDGNCLYGTDADELQSNGDGYYFKLTDHATKGVGFYWGADGGAAFSNMAHKAYVFLPSESVPASISFDLAIEDEYVSSIESTYDTFMQTNNASYNLLGQQIVGNNYKGIRICKGKKIIY